MNNKEKIICEECGSGNVVKKGRSKTKFQSKQIYKCKDCNKRFVFGLNNLAKSSKIIKTKHKVRVPEKTIYSWVKEFDKVCSYYRIRKKAIKQFKPNDIIFKKIFRHLQLYKYRYHKAKIGLFVNAVNVSESCPNELFKDSARSSNVKLNIDASKIKIFKKENYACRLASLALQFLDEIKEYRILELFENLLEKNFNDENSITKKYINEITLNNNNKGGNGSSTESKTVALHPPDDVKQNSAITGHIDFVQLKFGSIYVLDYKPNADKVSAVSQLFVYAIALSVRTGIWLRNFKCAWFDENDYYEFVPSDIILKFCHVPQNRFREFFVRNKERRYFTSKELQQDKKYLRFKRDNNLGNISSGQIGSVVQGSLDMSVNRTAISDHAQKSMIFDMVFGQAGVIAPDNFFGTDISSDKLENITNHNPSAIKSKFSVADFGVCNDIFVDFDSHIINSDNTAFKATDTGYSLLNFSRFSQDIGKISYYVSNYGHLIPYGKGVPK